MNDHEKEDMNYISFLKNRKFGALKLRLMIRSLGYEKMYFYLVKGS